MKLTKDQRSTIRREARLGVPLMAHAWGTTEAALLRIAGLSRAEHQERMAIRRSLVEEHPELVDLNRAVVAALRTELDSLRRDAAEREEPDPLTALEAIRTEARAEIKRFPGAIWPPKIERMADDALAGRVGEPDRELVEQIVAQRLAAAIVLGICTEDHPERLAMSEDMSWKMAAPERVREAVRTLVADVRRYDEGTAGTLETEIRAALRNHTGKETDADRT